MKIPCVLTGVDLSAEGVTVTYRSIRMGLLEIKHHLSGGDEGYTQEELETIARKNPIGTCVIMSVEEMTEENATDYVEFPDLEDAEFADNSELITPSRSSSTNGSQIERELREIDEGD